MEEENNGELAFLDTFLKRNNGKISVLVYRKPADTDQHLYYSSHHHKLVHSFSSNGSIFPRNVLDVNGQKIQNLL